MYTLKELYKTCDACPSQWEGRTTDNRPVYVRSRSGRLTAGVGELGEAVEKAVERAYQRTPDQCDFYLETQVDEIMDEKLQEYLGELLDFSQIDLNNIELRIGPPLLINIETGETKECPRMLKYLKDDWKKHIDPRYEERV